MQTRWERLFSMWQSDQNNLPLTVDLIDSLCQAGQFEQCQSVFDSMPKSLADTPEVCAKNIEFLFHLNQIPQALEQAQSLCELTNNHAIALHYLGLARYLSGDVQGVLALAELPNLTAETQVLVARALYHKGELSKALALVTSLDLPEAVGLAAMLYYDCNELDKANHCADMVLSHSDNQMDALLAKASILVNRQQMDEANGFIDRALVLQPHSGRALSVKGQIQFFNTQLDDATETFEQAVKYMPDHIGTWHLLGWCHFVSQRIDLAQQAFEQAMNLDRNFADSHGAIAAVLAVKGELAAAANEAKVALRLNPASYAGLYASAMIAHHSGDEHGASQIINGIMSDESHIPGKTNLDLISTVIKQRQLSRGV